MILATPFVQFLDTNYAPSEEEQKSLLALIRDPSEKIRKLEEEISRLEAERDGLKSFVDRHRALLSPFRRLPADVWREIFVYCLPNNKFGLCTRTTSEAPLLLTTICRSWRDIALSTPRLWNSIHVYLPVPKSGFDGDRFWATIRARNKGFRQWLEKSGSLPLTISLSTEIHHLEPIVGNRSSAADEGQKLQDLRAELINMLARYCHRWRIMAFGEATHSVVASAFGRLTTKDLPLLETIHSNGNVFFWQDSDTDGTNPIGLSVIGSLLGRASSLRALHLTGEYFSEQSLLSDLPLLWSRLTELCITPPSGHYYDCYKLLQLLAKECHSLASLDLVSQGVHLVQERGERRSSPVEWSSIRKFAISFIGSAVDRRPLELVFTRQVVEAFESVVLPSLKEFSVDLPGYHDLFPPPPSKISSTPWEQLLLRSQPAITHIQLSFPTSLEATAVFKSLQSLDTPKSLRFGCGNSRQIADEQFLPAFLEAGASLCPELEEVEFGKCGSAAAKSLLELAVIRPNLKVIRAHFFVSEDEVETLLPSAQVVHELKVTMNEREGTLQGYVKGVRLIWTWKSQDDPSRDAHTDGMPGDTLYW